MGLSDAMGRQSQTPLPVVVAQQTTEPPVTELVVIGCQGCYLVGGTESFTPSTGAFRPQMFGSSQIQITYKATNITGGADDFAQVAFSTQAIPNHPLISLRRFISYQSGQIPLEETLKKIEAIRRKAGLR